MRSAAASASIEWFAQRGHAAMRGAQGLLGAGLPADYAEFLLVILGAFKAGYAAGITDSVQRVEHGSALVDQAGSTMNEVVTSIRRVTDIMGEISAASTEQSQGVSQVGEAVTQMDQATQQNAALVEEMAAAASSLKSQSSELVQTVAVFKLVSDHITNTPQLLTA